MFSLQRTCALAAPCVAAVALALGVSAPARAQAVAAPAPSASPVSEIGRVSTSDRQDEPASAVTRTTYVVTKAQMLVHGDDTVADALARVPGVLMQQYGGFGGTAVVSIRGQRGDGILILLDGRPIAGAQIGATDLGAIPTAGIERIEVVEGAGATLYGNGASAGVINIITSRTTAAYATPIVSVAGGSYGYGKASIETANFSFSREKATNNYDVSYDPLFPPNATRVNADASSTNARFTDAGTFGDLRVSGSAGFVSRIIGVPGQDTFSTSFARQQDDTQDARVSLALVHAHATTTLDLGGTRETLTFLDPSVAEFGPELDFSTDARVQANLRNSIVSDGNRLIYGADLAHGVARNDGSGPYGAAYAVTPYAQTAVYTQDTLALGDASRIYAGLRGERDGAAGAALTPSLGATIGFGGGLAIKLNAGTAFRVPTAEDLAFPGFSNPTLQPERTQSFDATIAASHVLGGANFGWFVQTGTNLIAINPNVDYSQPFGPGNQPLINQPQSSVAGFVLDASSRSYNGVAAHMSITDTYRALGYSDGVAASRLVDRPVFSTSLDVGYTGAATNALAGLGAVMHTVGLLDAGGAGNYTTVDAYLRLRVAQHALVSLRVFDLGNERYQEVAGYPMPGRTVTLELSTR